jgi:hypothetical protein
MNLTASQVAPQMREDLRAALPLPFEAPSAAERWAALISTEADREAFSTMCRALQKTYFGSLPARVATWLFYRLVYSHAGHYVEDSDYLADATGIMSRAQMALMQRQYTWAHVAYNFVPGCTTTCIRTQAGWRMMRSLDWGNLPVMAPAVRAYDYIDSQQQITHTAAVQGMAGVLTFSRPGLCGAINFAPKQRCLTPARFRSDPLFVLRNLIEHTHINTLEAALEFIGKQRFSSPVFISLCSSNSDCAAVVEVAHDKRQNVRYAKDGLLVQTNHFHQASPFAHENYPQLATEPTAGWEHSDLLRNSQKRFDDLMAALSPLVDAPATQVESACLERYSIAPVWNHETTYWTLANPATGSLRLWQRQV